MRKKTYSQQVADERAEQYRIVVDRSYLLPEIEEEGEYELSTSLKPDDNYSPKSDN